MTPPTDREMLREKLERAFHNVPYAVQYEEVFRKRLADLVIETFDRYLAEYEPLRKKLPRFFVQPGCNWVGDRTREKGDQLIINVKNLSVTPQEVADWLNSQDRKEK